jgi:hypothetical protein
MKTPLVGVLLVVAWLGVPAVAIADEQALAARIEQLAAELEKVKAELAAQRAQATGAAQLAHGAPAPAPVAPPLPAPPAPVVPPAVAPAIDSAPATVPIAYGEINYNHPVRNASQSQADVRRAVIGFLHRFDDKTRLASEFEWEHAVVSSSDQGETDVEQLYVEREFTNGMRGRAGLFLMPVGLLNQTHEPTAYYGVERNFVETAIIPTTWREAGVGLSGDLPEGLSWDAGLTTGFDLSRWDPASSAGRAAPLAAIHQEGQLAKARDLSLHGALNWRGVPGLLVGGFVFTGKAGQETEGFASRNARVTLWDLHARYTPGAWDLSALYARGRISHTASLNLTFDGDPTPVPASFAGGYLQAAYRLHQAGAYTLSPFARYERFNTAKGYHGLPPGSPVVRTPGEQVLTVGANLRVGQGVVLKGDYQRFVRDKARDRVNLGVGFSY